MYFEDLTSYNYAAQAPAAGVFNVGWLDKDHAFNRGTPPLGFVAALKRWLLHERVNQTRGLQHCSFCPLEGYQHIRVILNGQEILLGSAELWIPSPNNGIFAAPTLILHYVEAHSYLPPAGFIEAVLRPIPPDWNAAVVAESLVMAPRKQALERLLESKKESGS